MVAYKMASVVRMTGFTPALLRAWERRYNLLRPARALSGHRLYTEEDLKILLQIKSLIAQGRSIGEIALSGRDNLLEAIPPRSMFGKEPEQAAKQAEPRLMGGMEVSQPLGLGNRTTFNGQLQKYCHDIVQAAVAIDAGAFETALDQAFSLVSPDVVIREVLEPSATKIGELWAKGSCSVAGEHLATGIFFHRLQKLIESSRPLGRSAPTAICACFPDEQHQVGTLVLAYFLCLHGFSVSYLGASLPFEELEHACKLIAPRAVYLSVTRPVVFLTHRPRLIEMLGRLNGSLEIYIGGGGVTEKDPELEDLGAKVWIGKCPPAGLNDNLLPK